MIALICIVIALVLFGIAQFRAHGSDLNAWGGLFLCAALLLPRVT